MSWRIMLENARTESNSNIGALRVCWIFCRILILRNQLESARQTGTLLTSFDMSLTALEELLEECHLLTAYDFESFWFSCKSQLRLHHG